MLFSVSIPIVIDIREVDELSIYSFCVFEFSLGNFMLRKKRIRIGRFCFFSSS
jgi:hypothetical protein